MKRSQPLAGLACLALAISLFTVPVTATDCKQNRLYGAFQTSPGAVVRVDTVTGGSYPFFPSGAPYYSWLSGVTTVAHDAATNALYLATGDGSDSLYRLDLLTNTITYVGALRFQDQNGAWQWISNVQAMDIAPPGSQYWGFVPGELYAISIDGVGGCNPNCFFRINKYTGAGTMIRGLGLNQGRGISFNPITGELWVYDAGGGHFYTLDGHGFLKYRVREYNIDTMFSLAHGCDGRMFGVDIAYGVVVEIDVTTGWAYWVGTYGSVRAPDGSFALQALDFDSLGTLPASCPFNPPWNSALAAHGNTDWHIDTAHEFLFGVEMDGDPSASNHCPDSWTRRHLHVGATNTRDYYYDVDRNAAGLDTDPVHGIERAMLFFYAGHGNPELWNTLGNSAYQSGVSIGDCPGGMLRYYWHCSCEVFAHGPRDCPGANFVYACPKAFDGSPDSVAMRNVYERWGPALGPPLRMACGSSTDAYCHETQTDAVWYRYNQLFFDVADSYLFGMATGGTVPLCITRGGSDINATPIIQDYRFTNLPNTSGNSAYYIIFIVYNSPPSIDYRSAEAIPEQLPVLTLGTMALPEALQSRRLAAEGELMLVVDDLGERGPRFAVDRRSGAVFFRGERLPALPGELADGQYVEQARSFLRQQGWDEESLAAPEVRRLVYEGRDAESDEVLVRGQKNVLVTLRRQVEVGGRTIPVLGLGGEMTVQLNNDGSVANAAKVWRPVMEAGEAVPVKPYEKAYEDAVEQLADPLAWRLGRWEWGYQEAPGNVEQTTMRVVYHFYFLPATPEAGEQYAPQMIEIAAQDE